MFRMLLVLFPVLASLAEASALPPLYQRLGGKKGVSALAGEFVDQLMNDSRLARNPRIKAAQNSVDRKLAKSRVSDELCKASGGSCKPGRKPLLNSSARDLKIGILEWSYILQDADAAMDKKKVGQRERKELLGLLLKAK